MTDLLITNARLIDPAAGLDAPGALLIQSGRIAAHGPSLSAPELTPTLDAQGAILAPGLVDMRASLGEPGFEHRETIASAARAAAAGGITTLCALPDTEPALDDPALLQFLIRRGEATGSLTILPYGAATMDCAGKDMAEFGLLREAGAIAFTDGRRAIASSRAMRLALSYARGFGCFIVQHPEDPSLAAGGAATEGELATRLGLPGIPAAAEAILVARDIALARLTRGHVHFAHVSTGAALDLIRAAKAEGLAVTCDTAPPISTSMRPPSATTAPTRSSPRPCAATRTGWRSWQPSQTARSTPSPRTTSRATPTTSACPSPRRRRVAPAWQRSLVSRSPACMAGTSRCSRRWGC